MRSRILIALIVSVSAVFLGMSAQAEGFYLAFATGASVIPDQDISGGGLSGEVSADAGYHVGGAVGIHMNEHLRGEVNLSYREADIDTITGPGISLEGAGTVGAFAALANVYFDLLPEAPVIPFLGAGIGLGVVTVDSDSGATVLIVDDSSVEFAWNVLAGLTVPVTDRFSLLLAYRYLATTNPELDATVPGVGSGTIEGEFDTHEAMFGGRFDF